MGNLISQIRAIYNRLRVLLTFSRVLVVNDTGPLQTFTLEGFVSEVRANVPRIGEWGLASSPPLGSQAVVAAIGGERGNLVVLGVEDRTTRPTLLPGEVQIYTAGGPVLRAYLLSAAQVVTLSGDQIEIGHASETATAKINAVDITVEGTTVAVNGNVTIQGSTIILNGINFDTHTHAVPGGGSYAGGVTGVPI